MNKWAFNTTEITYWPHSDDNSTRGSDSISAGGRTKNEKFISTQAINFEESTEPLPNPRNECHYWWALFSGRHIWWKRREKKLLKAFVIIIQYFYATIFAFIWYRSMKRRNVSLFCQVRDIKITSQEIFRLQFGLWWAELIQEIKFWEENPHWTDILKKLCCLKLHCSLISK